MSKKTEFINYVKTVINENDMSEEAKTYWFALLNGEDKITEKKKFTDNGKLILTYLQNENSNTPMKSKDIADQIGISSRSVAGAMKKLVSDGWVEAVGDSPKLYIITENGKNIKIED